MHNAIVLSPYHKIFYNEWQLDRQSSRYNIVFDQTIENILDIPRLSNALKRLISEYLILNRHITNIDGILYWVPNKAIRTLEIFEGIATYEQIYKFVSQSFDIENEPLYRFAIFNKEDGNYRFILVWHHLIMSDKALEESVELISKYYNDASYKNQITLEKQYSLFNQTTLKLNEQVTINEGQHAIFWENILKDLEAIDLGFLKPYSQEFTNNYVSNPVRELRFNFIYDNFRRILHISRQYGITPYMFSQCIFALLIHKYTGQNQFGFCYTVGITEHLGLTYGVAVNRNIHPNNISSDGSVLDLITQNKEIIKKIRDKKYSYKYFPINYIFSKISKSILNVNFITTYFKDRKFNFNNSKTVKINNDFNIDLAANLLFEQELFEGQLNFRVRYNINQIDEAILKQFVNHYQKLFLDVLSDFEKGCIDKKISDYSILTKEEYHKIVYEWNNTNNPYLENKLIHELFEEQASRTPNNIAVVFDKINLTYKELNQKANQLANYIKVIHTINPDDLIAFCLDRSEYILIAILAILKTGGAYVPIDPDYPDSRINYILEDTKSNVFLTNEIYLGRFSLLEQCQSNKIIAIDAVNTLIDIQKQQITVPEIKTDCKNLAYVIYTSGTTGKPKGVLIEHKGLVNLTLEMIYKHELSVGTRIALHSNFAFDASVYELFPALLSGSKIFLISELMRYDIELLSKYYVAHNIEISFIPTILLNEFILEYSGNSLRLVYVGGEKLVLAKKIDASDLGFKIINEYGPTEITVCATQYEVSDCRKNSQYMNLIGKPISNVTCYVLDKNLKPLPIWGIGELYIGGAGISRGYLNLSELTLERFIDNPFQSDKDKMLGKNSKLYKTGDLVRWLPDGNLEYIGRNDYQVKIRGYRIELGEIEDKLCQLKEIKQAIVCCQNHIDNLGLTNSQDLVAYYVLDNKYSDCELNSYLESWLEVYDNVYADLNLEDYKYNTCGWNSSYTSKPIPKVEMKDLIDNTVSRIVSLNPKNILEIGCGSGLILFNILNICDKYIATDFSSTSIEHLNNIITKQDLEYKYKVDTICCSAHELGNINFEYQVDTVIINSVVQYFPNIEYLINILELSISKIGKKGKIFLGDIRDYRLLKLFHFSILSYQNMSVNVDLIDEYSMQDTELLVSPNFFIYCKTLFNRIKHVDILPKIGSYNNEMNRFRYDVVLYIDDEVPQETCKIQPIYYNDIKSVLENTNAEEIFISYINIRIFNDYKEYNKLLDKHIDLPYTELLTIEEIYLLAAKYNYKLKILLDVDNSILLNLIFYRDKLENYHSDSITLINNLKMFDVANNPIQRVGLSDNALAELFEKYLLTQLPEYMVPNHYIKLPNVPLTLNGKVDYKALPPIKFFNEHTYVYPRTELEEKMVIIWSDILGIPKEQIGIEDNFFKLGGNSLLVVRLKKRLSIFEEFKQVTVVDIFKYTTIQQLTSFVMNKVNSTPSIKLINNSSYNNLDIAVIGISGAFSGGEDLEDFWEQINFDKCGLIRHTIDECRNSGIAEELLNHPDFIPVTGKIVGTNEFDSIFWEMQADEIHRLDPQVRKFLEHSWYVLESSGYLIDRAAINIGVFAGGRNSPCLYNNKPQFVGQVLGKLGAAGELNTQSSLAMQVSYILGLTGISTNVNTACSTSLVAIVEACKNLVAGYCDMAIAGGVSLILPSEYGYIYQNGGIFSKNGESRIFDANSSGMISGSGVGVVLLKPLEKAIEDKDNIIAVIKGYHINNDGTRKMSYTSPSVMGQVECIVNAQKIAGVSFDEIDYVECHGTGTQLGDAVEIQALNEAFNYNHTPNATFKKCYIGSVKANIGHAELASGVAGIIKVCKMLEHNVIPKQINFDTLNPNIPKNTPFIIPKSKQQWLRRGLRPRIAGVSSFGIGGTNAHLIISDYVSEDCIKNITPQSIPLGSVSEFNKSYRLPLSAKSKLSLEKYKKCFIDFLKTTKYDLSDIAYTLQLKREVYQYRSSVVANSISEAIEKFENNITITNVVNKNEVQNIIFMFPGQGSQYANMTLDLYQNNNEYKVILDNCISITNSLLGISFENILFPANQDDADTINQTQFAQLALFCVSYSIAKLLESLDVKSSAYLGHSIGELVAATLCGVFDLRDAIKLVIKRGKLMQSMQPGSMLLIQFDKDQLNKIICQNNCEVAVINSPQQFVVSGNPDDILKLKTQLDKELIPTTILKVSHGYHSYLMEDAANKFIDQFKVIKLYSPKRLFISNVTGDFIKPEDAVSPEYWSKHIRQKVLFMDGVKSISRYFTNPFFIQVGPGKELLTFVNQTYVKTVNSVALIDKNPDISNKYSKEEILNKLWLHGYKVNSAKYFDTNKFNKTVNLPNYSFDNQTYIFKGDHVAINNASLIRKSEKDPINRVLEANLPQLYYDIAKIFLELLMVDKISIHDNFFDLGGNSITSLSLITKLKNIGINLSLTDIININSIAKIYKFAHHSNSKIQDKIVVPLLVNNQRKKVFFIHPIGGTVIKYLKIIDRLKNQYDYYGIQNINISNINTIKVESLQELCSIYLEEILKIQDNGEYIFMGSSVGGNIAFEIARQLIQLGKTVKYIVMLDSWAKYFDKSDYPDKNIPALEESSYINHKNLKEFVSNTTYANLMGAGNNLLQLIFRYQPKKVDVKIYLCKANKLNPKHIKVENSWDNFWQKYTDIPVTVYNISGDHDTIFSNPGFSEILESINSIL